MLKTPDKEDKTEQGNAMAHREKTPVENLLKKA